MKLAFAYGFRITYDLVETCSPFTITAVSLFSFKTHLFCNQTFNPCVPAICSESASGFTRDTLSILCLNCSSTELNQSSPFLLRSSLTDIRLSLKNWVNSLPRILARCCTALESMFLTDFGIKLCPVDTNGSTFFKGSPGDTMCFCEGQMTYLFSITKLMPRSRLLLRSLDLACSLISPTARFDCWKGKARFDCCNGNYNCSFLYTSPFRKRPI